MAYTDRSFITIAEADAYWVDRDSSWAEFTDKEARLIRASEFILRSFYWVEDPVIGEEVSDQLKDAVSWLAFYASSELQAPAARGGEITRVKAGPVEVQWSENAPSGTVFSYLKKLLRGLITGTKVMRIA